MDIGKWSIPKLGRLYSLHPKMEKQKQDRELTVAQIMNSLLQNKIKLKKVGKPLDPQVLPYDYTVEVTNRFKGLDLIECLKNYGWGFITLTGGSDQIHPQ